TRSRRRSSSRTPPRTGYPRRSSPKGSGTPSGSCPTPAAIAASRTSISAPPARRSAARSVARRTRAAAASPARMPGRPTCAGRRARSTGAARCLLRKESISNCRLDLAPERIPLGGGERWQCEPALAREPLHCREAALEFRVRGAQCPFCIDPQVPRPVRDREEQIAELLNGMGMPASCVELSQLLEHLLAHVGRGGPVESHAAGAFAELLRAPQRGQRPRHIGEYAGLKRAAALGGCRPLVGLVLFPAPVERGRIGRQALLRKNVWMPPSELLCNRASDIRESEPAPLLGEASVEDDLEEQIAELVFQPFRIDRVGILDSVGILDRVGDLVR